MNTGDGDDIITGISHAIYSTSEGSGLKNSLNGFGLDSGNGNDIITGISNNNGIFNYTSTLNTGNGDDSIIADGGFNGIDNYSATINTGNGDDSIIADGNNAPDVNSFYTGYGIANRGTIDSGNGNDTITGSGDVGIFNGGFALGGTFEGTIDTGDGEDVITGSGITSGIKNQGIINTGIDDDSIISQGNLINSGGIFLGEGNDSIIANADLPNRALENFNAIETGDGNDAITSTGVIYNEGVINTGNGNDSIIVEETDTTYGIYNNGGAINMGDGNDSIIANEGFESAPNSSGAWFLGEGEDYIKGYGSGDFYGGNGNDTLELTPGTYTVGIWGEGSDTSAIFTKGNQLMITSEFERLKAGSTIYDFTSLTAGQIIVVA
jgi:hypothetical protein